jgi:hypothetical protein
MNDQILFVQFPHPGAEHDPKPKKGNFIAWNTGDHKRKFMKNPGQYENNCPKKSDLVFWGEWEPQSDVLQRFTANNNTYPKYLYKPYYSIPTNQQDLENTDPFIFGDRFHYVCCKQATKKGFTQLRFLDRGSVILFGSCVNQQFVLDTVFVVDTWKDDIKSFAQAKKLVSPTYQDVTLTRIFNSSCSSKSKGSCTKNISYRLYFGATYNKPVEGMFSFFPCLPYQQNMTSGFLRPIIQIPNLITNNCQKFKYEHPHYPKNIQTNQKLWEEVKRQVENANLKLGIFADLPPRKP